MTEIKVLDDKAKVSLLQDCVEVMSRIAKIGHAESTEEASKVLTRVRNEGWSDEGYREAFKETNLIYAKAPLSARAVPGLKKRWWQRK